MLAVPGEGQDDSSGDSQEEFVHDGDPFFNPFLSRQHPLVLNLLRAHLRIVMLHLSSC